MSFRLRKGALNKTGLNIQYVDGHVLKRFKTLNSLFCNLIDTVIYPFSVKNLYFYRHEGFHEQ